MREMSIFVVHVISIIIIFPDSDYVMLKFMWNMAFLNIYLKVCQQLQQIRSDINIIYFSYQCVLSVLIENVTVFPVSYKCHQINYISCIHLNIVLSIFCKRVHQLRTRWDLRSDHDDSSALSYNRQSFLAGDNRGSNWRTALTTSSTDYSVVEPGPPLSEARV
jgi:hypothetical protein